MEDTDTTDTLIRRLAADHRVVTLGGVAVISHGLNRNTTDADIWLDPSGSPTEWASSVEPILRGLAKSRPVRIGSWDPIEVGTLGDVIQQDGVFRVNGLDRPLDIFRDPNELEMDHFDEIWERAEPLDDGTRVLEIIDLLVTKQLTNRDKDLQDIAFLEAKAEKEYLERLPTANAAEATRMLDRFLTPKVAEAAMAHADPAVRDLGLHFLRELATDGDPFAQETLTRLENPKG